MNKLLISCKESRIENNRSFYGCFNLGPFEAGQSLTVANALRRTLLSECTGIAIVSVMIENVHHEYSTLPGVRDSILDILLNLKEIVFKKTKNPYGVYKKKSIHSVYEGVGDSFFKPVIGYLKVRGPGVIRAKDLRLPPVVQCVDPEQYIATLGDDGFFNMKFIIMEGKNYILGKSTRDSGLLKKREVLLKGLKELMEILSKNSFGILTSTSNWEGVTSPAAQSVPTPKRDWNDNFCNNATQLDLDAVFNPVTKVNYIIEVNENKLVENSNKKYSLIEDITSLMNSTDHLKTAFPFLSVGKNSLKTENSLSLETKTKELIEYVENLSTVELNNVYNSLHPLKKESTTHNVILEVWTNGSMHPRDALSMAFENLSNIFLNLRETEIMNPVFNDWASYKKTLSSFNVDAATGDGTYKAIDTTLIPTQNLGDNYMSSINKKTMESYKNLDISTLNVSLRTYTKLKLYNIQKIGDLIFNWNDISSTIEKKCLKEIIKSLKEINIFLE